MLPAYTNTYNSLVDDESPFEIDLSFDVTADGQAVLNADVLVTGAVNQDDENKILFLITYNYSDSYSCTVRRYAEQDFSLTELDATGSFTESFDFDPSWLLDKISAVAIIQKMNGTTGNYPIHQAALAKSPMGVFVPVQDFILQVGTTETFSIASYFTHEGDPTDFPVTVESLNPEVCSVTVDGTNVTVEALTQGSAQISLFGTYGDNNALDIINVATWDPDVRSILILDLVASSVNGVLMKESLETIYENDIYLGNSFGQYAIAPNLDAIFVLCGIYGGGGVMIAEENALPLIDYATNGGNLYIEGGDTWGWDNTHGGYDFNSFFGIQSASDGGSDLGSVEGAGFLSGISSSYSGGNNYIDQMTLMAGAEAIFNNATAGYTCGVAYETRETSVVGLSFELAGLETEALNQSLAGIIDFFDISTVNENDPSLPAYTGELRNYPNPFNPQTTIAFDTKEKGYVSLDIFNIKGQKVKTLVDGEMEANHHTIVWTGKDDSEKPVGSGIYFYKLKSGNHTSTKKMVLLK